MKLTYDIFMKELEGHDTIYLEYQGIHNPNRIIYATEDVRDVITGKIDSILGDLMRVQDELDDVRSEMEDLLERN